MSSDELADPVGEDFVVGHRPDYTAASRANGDVELGISRGRHHGKEVSVPGTRASVKNEKQYEGLKKKGMSKERAAKIANSPGASSRGGKKSGKKKS
jgi:hypothetical protein